MEIGDLSTPSFILDLDQLQRNIAEMSQISEENKKELWPMTKTHKSSKIAKMQAQAGAKGFLTGTLDEAEKLIEAGLENIMLAYPVAGSANVERVIKLGRKANLIASFDGPEAAEELNTALEKNKQKMKYLLLIDCGFGRFGVSPEQALDLRQKMQGYGHLKFVGISTHPGQVYGAANFKEVLQAAEKEGNALEKARKILTANGFEVKIVATGSTPTAKTLAKSEQITVLRPGNYVFYDQMQKKMGVTTAGSCALTVLATIISNPRPNLFIMDAGSKVLGLDRGAHGVSLVEGYGKIKGYPDHIITGLSEEVGKIESRAAGRLRVGQQIQIVPNHACAAANNTSFFLGCRKGKVEEVLEVDLRGGSHWRWGGFQLR
ncbi:MAG: amino-acid racemase [Firmicutes bacterium]|nr:amino-acid racemase [Bacillota bacterium]